MFGLSLVNAGPADESPAEISESIEGLTTHKYGDVAEYIQGKHIEGHAGDYAITRTGDVTRTITGNVTESIESGSLSINNNLMAKKTSETITGNHDYVATVSGNVTESSTITGNYTQLITAASASTTVSGNLNWIKSAESQFVGGMCTKLFGGVKAIANLGFVSDFYRGGKYENHAGIIVNGAKTKNESINVMINNYSQTLVVKTTVNITNAKLTMVC